jgi:UPF0716 protein FxsA
MRRDAAERRTCDMWLLLTFLALPIIEIALFIQVGGLIGLWPTLGLVILAAFVGLSIIRAQGISAIARLQARVAAGDDPSGPIANAALIVIAGVLLLVPGFFTDAVGLVLLIPAARRWILRAAGSRIRTRGFVFTRPAQGDRRPQSGETIEADYEVLDDVPPSQRGASGWTRGQP